MKEHLFQLDNPVWVFMGRIVDFVLLTGLWLLGSLPVVTVGASTKALYTVAMHMAKNEEGYTARSFVQAFREGFKESTLIGLAVLAAGVFLCSDLYVYWRMTGRAGVFLFTVFLVLTAVYLLTLSYLYPLMAGTEYRGMKLVLAAFVTACKNPGWALLLMTVMAGTLLVGVFVFAPLLAVGVGLAAYVQCRLTAFVTRHYHIRL